MEEGDIIMKTIVVACGGGVATSQTCAVKLADLLEKNGISPSEFRIEAININSMTQYEKVADIYVSICGEGEKEFDLPTFNGGPFITGMGAEEELQKILEEFRK